MALTQDKVEEMDSVAIDALLGNGEYTDEDITRWGTLRGIYKDE